MSTQFKEGDYVVDKANPNTVYRVYLFEDGGMGIDPQIGEEIYPKEVSAENFRYATNADVILAVKKAVTDLGERHKKEADALLIQALSILPVTSRVSTNEDKV